MATDDIAGEAARIYQLLQTNVDEQIHNTGFVPPHDYGMSEPVTNPGRNGSAPHSNAPLNGGRWSCSDKQRDLIHKLVKERDLDLDELERTAIDLFGHGLSQMDKAEASGLLDSLMAKRRLGERRRHTTPGNRPYVGDGRRGQ